MDTYEIQILEPDKIEPRINTKSRTTNKHEYLKNKIKTGLVQVAYLNHGETHAAGLLLNG